MQLRGSPSAAPSGVKQLHPFLAKQVVMPGAAACPKAVLQQADDAQLLGTRPHVQAVLVASHLHPP